MNGPAAVAVTNSAVEASICTEVPTLSAVIAAVWEFDASFRRQWLKCAKPFGLEVIQARNAVQAARLEETALRIRPDGFKCQNCVSCFVSTAFLCCGTGCLLFAGDPFPRRSVQYGPPAYLQNPPTIKSRNMVK